MLSFLSSAWGWIQSVPGLLSAIYTAFKSGLLICSGVILENDRETRERNAQTIKSLRDAMFAGDDASGMSTAELDEKLRQRGLLRGVRSSQTKAKPKG